MNQANLRNIAIIAHVDHGKTTLVDAMLKQTQTFAAHEQENKQSTILDSNELERERGVTILAKNTAVSWQDYKINILDTPGHADFSGEVERVLNMADGCILLVDAAEGVLSQTKFVLRLALEQNLTPIVVINKVDRKDQRVDEVESEIGDLFLDLATNEDQLNFPVLYARGIDGVVGLMVEENADHSLRITDSNDLTPLFTTLIETIPAPQDDASQPLQLQVNALDFDDHLGKISIGRIFAGTLAQNDQVILLQQQPSLNEKRATITKLFVQEGLKRVPVQEAHAGEIVAVAGIQDPHIGDTIADPEHPKELKRIAISEPTVKIQMSVNTAPFSGREAEYSTSRQLRNRLNKELETNVGLKTIPSDSGESITLVGRGELHLAILIETMRREGYEFSLSRPEVALKEIDDVTHEPWELVTIDVPKEYNGYITTSMGKRKAELKDMKTTKQGTRFTYEIATANLIGYRHELISNTAGEGVLNSTFLAFKPQVESIEHTRGGAVIAHETGTATAYAIEKAGQRTTLFIAPGDEVYAGQVVGVNNRQEDMIFNVTKGKKLTNMRAASADATVVLAPPWKPSLEQFLTLIGNDEMLEVTPKNLRLRKRDLVKAVRR